MTSQVSKQFSTGHVGLNVSDLERSKEFYQSVFGFQVVGESKQEHPFAFLGDGKTIALTLWQQSGGVFVTDRPGLHHLSFQVETMEQVQAAERRLRERGVVIHHGGIVPHAEGADSGGVYFEDPDGIRLEIFAPTGAGAYPAPHAGGPSCGFF